MNYSSSFTARGLFFNEFEAIYPFIVEENTIDFLRRKAKENLYLKISSESARKRVVTG
jgi:hypothetical protein